jgi:hypothetical protein
LAGQQGEDFEGLGRKTEECARFAQFPGLEVQFDNPEANQRRFRSAQIQAGTRGGPQSVGVIIRLPITKRKITTPTRGLTPA